MLLNVVALTYHRVGMIVRDHDVMLIAYVG
jgi:hypothetical protein